MTREELKAHCERQVQQFERVEKIMPVTLNDWKRYEEHKLVLELLEQEPILDKIRAEIEQVKSIMNDEIINNNRKDLINFVNGLNQSLVIIDKYKTESEDKE